MFSYDLGRSIVMRIFGPKAHKSFPKDTRLKGGTCRGEGFFPSKLDKSGTKEYEYEGVDVTIEEGKYVCIFT